MKIDQVNNQCVLSIENVWKQYRLGIIGHGSLYKDLQSYWSRLMKKDDPNKKISFGDNITEKRIEDEKFWALRNISLELQQGETLGIIGENGAGKSTLLKIVSRVTAPTRGTVKIAGKISSLLEVGTGFHPELTGKENIYLNGAILGMTNSEIKKKLDDIISFAEVSDFADTPVKRYSSGMYVRLAFSVAAHLDPDILVVDEVLAVGDAAFQRKCLGKMSSISRAGRTILFVSHNMNSITSLCERAILIKEGKIIMDDVSSSVVNHYLGNLEDYLLPKSGEISLNKHPTRKKFHDRAVQLTHCRIIDEKNNSTVNIMSGSTVKVVIGYKMNKIIKSENITFGISFTDKNQYRLFHCSTEIIGISSDKINSSGEIICVIPRLPLRPDIYKLDLGINVSGRPSDAIYGAIGINVIQGDYYGNGSTITAGSGDLLVDYSWEA